MLPSITEAAAAIAAREVSPVELTRTALERAESLQGELHAFIRLTPDLAIRAAHAAEDRQVRGALLGPLDGIPIGHKDIYETAGVATTAHSRLLQDHVPAEDAAVVRRWAEVGAVTIGKLATHEFAWGGPSFDVPWPPARNPWDTRRFTGGSSSGTAAAVAAGIVCGGTGSDTGGSIRAPAGLCGIAGIKPTYGLCSRRGVIPLAQSLDTAGPMARTAEDCAILLSAMAGHDPADPSSARRDAPDLLSDLSGGVRGLRVGVIRHFHEEDSPASPGVLAGIRHLGEVLRAEGAEVRDVRLPPLQDFHAAGSLILMSEAMAVHEAWLRERSRDYGEILRARLALAALIPASDYVQAQRRRRALREAVSAAMRDLDLLVTAAHLAEAPPIQEVGHFASLETPGFTMPFNLTGQPALTVPTGFGANGMPVGAQIVGRAFEDATVLRAGHAYERVAGWHWRRPSIGVER